MPHIQLHDLDMYYEEVGVGRAVLFLHGAFSRGVIAFGTQLTLLHRSCRGLYPDLRGHGRTRCSDPTWSLSRMADDVLLFCGALGLEQVHVVGYSMGGSVALYAACREPDRFASIATIGTAGCVTRTVTENAVQFEPEALEQSGREDFIEAVRANHMQAHDGDWKSLVRQTTASWRSEPQLADVDLARIGVPCLFMAGEEDELVRREHLDRLAGAVGNGQVFVAGGCGHGVHQVGQAPQEVHERLFRLWEEGEAPHRGSGTAFREAL